MSRKLGSARSVDFLWEPSVDNRPVGATFPWLQRIPEHHTVTNRWGLYFALKARAARGNGKLARARADRLRCVDGAANRDTAARVAHRRRGGGAVGGGISRRCDGAVERVRGAGAGGALSAGAASGACAAGTGGR